MSFLLMDGDENLLVDSAQQFSLKLGCEPKAQVIVFHSVNMLFNFHLKIAHGNMFKFVNFHFTVPISSLSLSVPKTLNIYF